MVKDEHRVCQHKDHVWQPQFILGRRGKSRFKEAHHVIGQIAHRTAMKDRYRVRFRRLIGFHDQAQFLQRIRLSCVRAGFSTLLDLDLMPSSREDQSW